MKINQAVANYFDRETLEDLTGISAASGDTPAYEQPMDVDTGETVEDEQ